MKEKHILPRIGTSRRGCDLEEQEAAEPDWVRRTGS